MYVGTVYFNVTITLTVNLYPKKTTTKGHSIIALTQQNNTNSFNNYPNIRQEAFLDQFVNIERTPGFLLLKCVGCDSLE